MIGSETIARSGRTTVVIALALLITCRPTYQSSRSIVVPGNVPPEQKLKIAEETGRSLYRGTLQTRLKARFPKLTDRQLEGRFIRWNENRFIPFAKGAKAAPPVVVLTVGIAHRGDVSEPDAIAQFSATLLTSELQKRLVGLAKRPSDRTR